MDEQIIFETNEILKKMDNIKTRFEIAIAIEDKYAVILDTLYLRKDIVLFLQKYSLKNTKPEYDEIFNVFNDFLTDNSIYSLCSKEAADKIVKLDIVSTKNQKLNQLSKSLKNLSDKYNIFLLQNYPDINNSKIIKLYDEAVTIRNSYDESLFRLYDKETHQESLQWLINNLIVPGEKQKEKAQKNQSASAICWIILIIIAIVLIIYSESNQ